MVERIFDIISDRYVESSDAPMLAAKRNGKWCQYTCREVWETARKLAGGIQSLGIKKQSTVGDLNEKIAIISPNCPEWIITDVGVQLAGAILTPVYPTISPMELEFVLRQADVHIVFISDDELYERFRQTFQRVESIIHVISFAKVDGAKHWQELVDLDLQPDESIIAQIGKNDLATIIYTSGTTGDPKGVMLSHNNIVSNVFDSMPAFTFAFKKDKALSFLPLNHIFERTCTYIYLARGLTIYYAENLDTIGANLKEVKPVVFTTVPRVLEKVFERIMNAGTELRGIKHALFFWALALGNRYDNILQGSAWYRLQLALANKLVFVKWREALGGNVKAIVVGSAPTQERLIRIFSAARLVIMEGYGLTETSPVVSVNRYESENRRIGTIGPLIPEVSVRITDDGEILCKGPNIMMGYYKNPKLTSEVMRDGWFYTGDLGLWIENRFLKVTGRKKEIFKTSGGKYVAPQAIENKMKESPLIEQMMVIGENRKFVSALVVPAFTQLRKYLQESNPVLKIPVQNADLLAMPEAGGLLQKEIDQYNPLFSHPEQIKKIVLLPNEWTIDGGELTPSLKIKRKFILKKYAQLIEAIYE